MKHALPAAAALLMSTLAHADERKFTYSYEAQTLPKGTFEFEQWSTLMTRKEAGLFRKLFQREEVEYGITDSLTTALYVNWEYLAVRGVPGLENEHEVEFESVSSEWKYKLTDRSIDPVGLLLYAEITYGDDEVELEGKLVLNKVIGDFHLVYNLIFEFAREKAAGGWETEYVVSNTFGISYAANANFAVGLEAVQLLEFEDSLGEQEHNVWFAGPNWHVAAGRWWATLTTLVQLDLSASRGLELDDHEKYEVRLIVGTTF